ncbi:hypothetical protein SCUCBS95973_008518 [Sporothrix curviconia]|uniref:FHA domain-containing protein n=1 Tax=Sporothrix curviconia TaxID=1260050 RepID=A0ABP0CM83_9PEZI
MPATTKLHNATMIEPTTLAEAQIVVVGLDGLTSANITVVTEAETDAGHNISNDPRISVVHATVQDLLVKDDGAPLLRDSSLVLAANIPRPVELALSHLRGKENPERPLIIMRGRENACKMRCQYRELRLPSGAVAEFVALEDDLPPWTDEKRDLVASTVQDLLRPANGGNDNNDDDVAAYLASARYFVGDYDARGAWPTVADYDRVAARVDVPLRSSQQEQILRQLCEGGLGASPWSIRLLARIIALDARRLLTGDGQPHNNTELQDVIRIAAERLSVSA